MSSAQQVENPSNKEDSNPIIEAIRLTSRKIKAMGAGLTVFLKSVEKITFSKDPVHVPDDKLIDEAVRLLAGEETAKTK